MKDNKYFYTLSMDEIEELIKKNERMGIVYGIKKEKRATNGAYYVTIDELKERYNYLKEKSKNKNNQIEELTPESIKDLPDEVIEQLIADAYTTGLNMGEVDDDLQKTYDMLTKEYYNRKPKTNQAREASKKAESKTIFIDESRIDPKHSYLTAANAANLGYLKEDDSKFKDYASYSSFDLVYETFCGIQEIKNKVTEVENELKRIYNDMAYTARKAKSIPVKRVKLPSIKLSEVFKSDNVKKNVKKFGQSVKDFIQNMGTSGVNLNNGGYMGFGDDIFNGKSFEFDDSTFRGDKRR